MGEPIPENRILTALIARLESVCSHVKVGYPATGLEDDLEVPAILVQLESLIELNRSGQRGLYQLQFLISLAVRTSEASTESLLQLSHQIRQALALGTRLCPEARKLQLTETQFDIAPAHGRLSFADIGLQVDTVLSP
ncbi:hypothetical protein GCM10023116_09930 [Kistimonas scapharcae]|uniref:DUF3168 domain-containing protein n=1 Tax=Kistimonas scapharcae TaxID=1036133 RepID=A0ABP8V1H8_9GAMM